MRFEEAMACSGLLPRSIVPDGKWKRCPTQDKPRKRNGAYLLSIDGSRGWWRNFALEGEFNTWTGESRIQIDQSALAERARIHQRREAAQRATAINSMRQYFAGLSSLDGEHPYLKAKGLTVQGCAKLRRDGDLLVIPMYRGASLMSIQTIAPDGTKRFRAHCPVAYTSFDLGSPTATITCLAEGFATGLAIYQSVPRVRVVVCFDAGNLVRVAADRQISGPAVVCADNDWKNHVNVGMQKGLQAAQQIGCGIAYPEGIEGTDWADALAEWRSPARLHMEIVRRAKVCN